MMTFPALYTAVHIADDETRTPLGAVLVDADHYVDVVDAEPGCLALLNTLTEALNARDVIDEKTGGAERYALEIASTGRSDPGFWAAARRHLQQVYSVTLQSPQELERGERVAL